MLHDKQGGIRRKADDAYAPFVVPPEGVDAHSRVAQHVMPGRLPPVQPQVIHDIEADETPIRFGLLRSDIHMNVPGDKEFLQHVTHAHACFLLGIPCTCPVSFTKPEHRRVHAERNAKRRAGAGPGAQVWPSDSPIPPPS